MENLLRANAASVEQRDRYGNPMIHFALRCAHPNYREIVHVLMVGEE